MATFLLVLLSPLLCQGASLHQQDRWTVVDPDSQPSCPGGSSDASCAALRSVLELLEVASSTYQCARDQAEAEAEESCLGRVAAVLRGCRSPGASHQADCLGQELSSWPPAGTAPCSSEAAVCTTLASFAKHTAATISLTCTLAETRYHTDLPSRQDEEAVGRPHMLPGQVVAGDLQLVPMVYPNFEEDFRAKGAATLEAYNSSSRGGRQSSAYPTLALEEAGLGELAASETGRHLLLVTLLEDPHLPIWQPRCFGRLSLFLPASLRAPEQPLEVPEGALLLGEVVEEGAVVTREQVVARFAALVPPELHRVADRLELATFSFYNSSHRAAVSGLAHWLVELDFPAALSLLATLHGLASPDLLLEVLTLTILGRRDCGLAMPDRAFIRPELYPVEWEEDEEEEGEVGNVHHHRQRRQLPQFVDWSDNGSGYFRENPRMNSHYSHWHTVNSPGSGDIFAFMHQQMLHRYDAERRSAGLGWTEPLGPEDWVRRTPSGFDSRNPAYAPRVRGVMGEFPGDFQSLLRAIDNGVFGGYEEGVDEGIMRLGRVVDGNIHNWGHMALAAHTPPGARGLAAIGTTSGSARDPIFYRWHMFIESLFRRYKARLGPYSVADLELPGVTVVQASLQQAGRTPNWLASSIATETVNMAGWPTPTRGNENIWLRYRSMAHEPFTLEVGVMAEEVQAAVFRAFLVSSEDSSLVLAMDHWLELLRPGFNTITRHETEAPHLSRRPGESLRQLQQELLSGRITRDQLNWAGCGWPRAMNLPTGPASGRPGVWHLVVTAHPILPSDWNRVRQWEEAGRVSWTFCGVANGVVPDSRPPGFPLDRPFDIPRLPNIYSTDVNIFRD